MRIAELVKVFMFKRTWLAISCKVTLKSGFDHKLRDTSFPGTIFFIISELFKKKILYSAVQKS